MGCAYNQVPSDATGFPQRNERFLVQHLVETDPDAGQFLQFSSVTAADPLTHS
jgi:hypothetical protein